MVKARISIAAICLAAVLPLYAQTGTVEGHVKLTGAAPRNPPIPMGADPNCLTLNAGKRVLQEVVLRAADGGLANVFVNLRGSFAKAAAPGAAATIDQRGCVYHPRIQGAQIGQTLQIKNSDSTLHNIHSMTTKGNAFNTGQPQAGMVFKYQLKSEEVMLHVKCDVHPWMTGYIGIVPHPYYAVSDATGAFRIANVPAGKQTIEIWHERYGKLTQTVDVKAGATATVDFAFAGTEKRTASADDRPVIEIEWPAEASAIEIVAPGPAF